MLKILIYTASVAAQESYSVLDILPLDKRQTEIGSTPHYQISPGNQDHLE